MLHSRRFFIAMLVLSMVAAACAMPSFSVQDVGPVSTAAAQTVIAALTMSSYPTPSPSLPLSSLTFTAEPLVLSPTFTLTPAPPTATPTQTLTPTLPFTPTPVIPLLTVSVPTNCRTGPGKVYPRVGALLVGVAAEVYGRDRTGLYWYIRNPQNVYDFCWVWGEYATVSGNIALLPVYTPAPTPTATFTPTPSPAFELSYSGLDECEGWWVEMHLKNTGSLPFRSMSIIVKDTATGVVLARSMNGFVNKDGCDSPAVRDVLGIGKAAIVSAPPFGYDPSGHKIRVTVTLCSAHGQNGTCVTRSLVFRP